MNVFIYLPFLLALPLIPAARRISRRGRPAVAARALTLAAVVIGATTFWSLLLLALTLVDDLPQYRVLGENPLLHLPEPVPDQVGVLALGVLAWVVARFGMELAARLNTLRRLRAVGPGTDGLVVADWTEPVAVAVPGRPDRVLVTSGLLRLLDTEERRVVFAHERAHLVHRHHRLVWATALAAAVHPLLVPVRDAVAFLAERWADEDAAAEVGDRDLTARAVARAALATGRPEPRAALAMHGGVVVRRVRALTEPAPEPSRSHLIGPGLIGATCVAAAVLATVAFVELARAWL